MSKQPAQPVAYILLLGAALLLGCGSLPLTQGQLDKPVAESPVTAETSVLETPPPEPIATSIPEPEVTVSLASASDQIPGRDVSETGVSSDSLSIDSDELSVAQTEPEIGEITFALGVTDEYAPIDPGFLFTIGVTEIHAVFNYSGMSPDYTWERVWYLNDKEVSRTSSAWTGPDRGVFDYFIDNEGKPLPAGDWILELYVEGELHSLSVFIIE